MTIHTRNIIQCPACGFKTTVSMPRQKKLMQYTCEACGHFTEASDQECCIFCKLGRHACIPVQERLQK